MARYIGVDADVPRTAQMAVTVIDDWHGRSEFLIDSPAQGVGSLATLLRHPAANEPPREARGAGPRQSESVAAFPELLATRLEGRQAHRK